MLFFRFIICICYAQGKSNSLNHTEPSSYNFSFCVETSSFENEIIIREKKISMQKQLEEFSNFIANISKMNITKIYGISTLIDGKEANSSNFIRIIDEKEKITISGFTFTNFKNEIINSKNASIDIINCSFIENFIERNALLNFENCNLKMENIKFDLTQTHNSFILSCKNTSFFMSNCDFNNSFSYSSNPFVYFNNSKGKIKNTLFRNNRTPLSSLITYNMKSYVFYEKTSFITNSFLNMILINKNSRANFIECFFKDNIGSILSSFNSQQIMFNYSIFQKNFSPDLPLLSINNISLNNCSFVENSGSPIIELKNGFLKINDCNINYNKAQSYFLKANNSYININNTSIINESSTISIFKFKFSNVSMSHLYFYEIWQTLILTFGSTMSLINSNFKNKIALNQAIINSKSTNITIKNTSFQIQTNDPLIKINQGNVQLSQLSFSTTQSLSFSPILFAKLCNNCLFTESKSIHFNLIYLEILFIIIIMFWLFKNKIFVLLAYQRRRGID